MSYAARETSVFSGQPYELYRFETADAAWYLTSGDKARLLDPGGSDEQEYTPAPISRTELGKGSEQKANSIKVTIPRDHAIAQLFVVYLPVTPVSLVVLRGHEGEAETIVQFTGTVLSASFGEDCELNCAPEEYVLQQRIPRQRYQTPCNKVIYSAACGVDPEAFRVDGTVTAIAADVISAAEFGAHPDGWFTNGYLQWGNYRRMIIRHVGNDVTLIAALSAIEVDDPVSAFPGCARTYAAACIGKFSNGPQFQGFEWIPRRNPFMGVQW